MNFFSKLKDWAVHTAWPHIETFLGNITADGLAAALPHAQAAVAELVDAEVTAITSGNTKDTGHILAKVVRETSDKIVAAGLTVGRRDILTAVGAAIPAKTGS